MTDKTEGQERVAALQGLRQVVESAVEPAVPAQHPAAEFCFFCVPDEIALEGFAAHDRREAYQGPTVHWQVPESFCSRLSGEEGQS